MCIDTKITVKWELFERDGERYLRELWSNAQGHTEWGPIPDDVDVDKLIEHRKAQISAIANDMVARRIGLNDGKSDDQKKNA